MEFLAFISNFNNWLDIDMFKEHIFFQEKYRYLTFCGSFADFLGC